MSVGLSRLLRYHPHIVQEPTCRMVMNNVLTALKGFGGALAETGAKAIEDTVTVRAIYPLDLSSNEGIIGMRRSHGHVGQASSRFGAVQAFNCG